MIGIDTSILVYAMMQEAAFHKQALTAVYDLAISGQSWAIPWPCIYEFIAVTTHKKIYSQPARLEQAFDALKEWKKSFGLQLIGERENSFESLNNLTLAAKLNGTMIHDAKIANICIDNGVSKLWTVDRDFSRFVRLKTENPLL